jgi:hypothetical protein
MLFRRVRFSEILLPKRQFETRGQMAARAA